MTRIISFFSPKTAGASSVSLNAVLLHKILNAKQKAAFIEVSRWNSQTNVLQAQDAQSWEKFFPFFKTEEWNQSLLPRLSFSLGADFFWSPQGQRWPSFNQKKASALLQLLRSEYDLIVIDMAASVSSDWHRFFTQASDVQIGVLTPDPISLKAWNTYLEAFNYSAQTRWLFNQVPNSEKKKLFQKYTAEDENFLGCLRSDEARFWRQCYEGQPVSVQASGRFKKDLVSLLPRLLSA